LRSYGLTNTAIACKKGTGDAGQKFHRRDERVTYSNRAEQNQSTRKPSMWVLLATTSPVTRLIGT